MNNTALLERTLKAMIESRDDVANSISEVPKYKADYERRVAQATAQLAEHDACIKNLEAAIAEQAKPREPIGYIDLQSLPEIGQRGLNGAYMSFKQYDVDCSPLYTQPQALEPMSDADIGLAIDAIDFSQMVTADDYQYLIARAIEAKLGVKK